jgi:hypothetical protein
MKLFTLLGTILFFVGLYWWLALPWLRQRTWWDGLVARLWAIAGNSKTIVVGSAAELLGLLDEAKLLDWSALIGSEKAGRVMVVMGAAMIVLRLITRAGVSFKVEA